MRIFHRNVQILRFAQDDSEPKRVILSVAKNLYTAIKQTL